jgi:hypothetical protein
VGGGGGYIIFGRKECWFGRFKHKGRTGDGKRRRRTKRGTHSEKVMTQLGGFFGSERMVHGGGGFFRKERMVHGGGYRRIGMGK